MDLEPSRPAPEPARDDLRCRGSREGVDHDAVGRARRPDEEVGETLRHRRRVLDSVVLVVALRDAQDVAGIGAALLVGLGAVSKASFVRGPKRPGTAFGFDHT